MEHWAKAIPAVQFLCVCVESKRIALAFHNMFRFQKVINSYIPSRDYMPVGFGQLGCSGFIVSDKDGNFVSRKTRAYLQYGDAAFQHVESILAKLVQEHRRDVMPVPPAVPSKKRRHDVEVCFSGQN